MHTHDLSAYEHHHAFGTNVTTKGERRESFDDHGDCREHQTDCTDSEGNADATLSAEVMAVGVAVGSADPPAVGPAEGACVGFGSAVVGVGWSCCGVQVVSTSVARTQHSPCRCPCMAHSYHGPRTTARLGPGGGPRYATAMSDKDDVTRRSALHLGLAAAGIAMTACSSKAAAQPQPVKPPAQPPSPALGKAPDPHALVPLPFDASKLDGLSAKLVTLHHDKNYGGAVEKLNAIRERLPSADPSQSGSYWSEYGTLKAGEAAARNSALLHELYFDNLIGPGQTPPAGIGRALGERFGSVERAVAQIKACGKATGGWVILALDATTRTLEVVPTEGHRGGAWHAEALLVLDVFEHSYALDYGPDKGAYLDAFFRNLNWQRIGQRFDHALA